MTTFRKLLLTVCQHEFDNRESYFKNLYNNATTKSTPIEVEARLLAKKKMLGNVKFIGELGKLDLLNEAILHKCIRTLLEKRKDEKYSEMSDDLECLCKMMPTIGLKLDQGEAVKLMDQYFDRIKKLQSIKDITQRIRFLLQDLVELRENKWIERQTQLDNAPRTMKELRRGTEFEDLPVDMSSTNMHPPFGPQMYPYGIPPHMFNFPYGIPPYSMPPPPPMINGKDPGFGFYQQYSPYQQQNDFYNNYFNSNKNTSMCLSGSLTKTSSASSVVSNQSISNINNNNNGVVHDEIKLNQQNNNREKLNSSSSSSSSYSSTNSYNNKLKEQASSKANKLDFPYFNENNNQNGKFFERYIYFYIIF